jgi:HK97 gp10 family phage protein
MAEFSAHIRNADVKNFNRITSNLKKYSNDGFYNVLQDGASKIVFKAKSRVPVKTGDLRRSIGVDGDKRNIIIKADMQYAGYVEFGTQRQKAKPYFFNSIRQGIRLIKKQASEKLRKILR